MDALCLSASSSPCAAAPEALRKELGMASQRLAELESAHAAAMRKAEAAAQRECELERKLAAAQIEMSTGGTPSPEGGHSLPLISRQCVPPIPRC